MIGYILADIAAVLCIAILVVGVFLAKRMERMEEEFDAEWMSEERWEESK